MVAEQIANEFYKLRNTNAKNVYKKDSKKTTFACIIKKDDYENEFDTCTKVLITQFFEFQLKEDYMCILVEIIKLDKEKVKLANKVSHDLFILNGAYSE